MSGRTPVHTAHADTSAYLCTASPRDDGLAARCEHQLLVARDSTARATPPHNRACNRSDTTTTTAPTESMPMDDWASAPRQVHRGRRGGARRADSCDTRRASRRRPRHGSRVRTSAAHHTAPLEACSTSDDTVAATPRHGHAPDALAKRGRHHACRKIVRAVHDERAVHGDGHEHLLAQRVQHGLHV
jgi:hypothetical protein